MKLINVVCQKSLKVFILSAASLVSLQAASSDPAPSVPIKSSIDFSASARSKAWQDLQNKITSLSASSALEDLLAAESSVVTYQTAFAQARDGAWSDDMNNEYAATEEDLLNTDASNPIGLLQTLVDFSQFGSSLLETRTGSSTVISHTLKDYFYQQNESLLKTVSDDFMGWEEEMFNADWTNTLAFKQVKAARDQYDQDLKQLKKRAYGYKRAELDNAFGPVALTADEVQLWNRFGLRLIEESKSVCSAYRMNPTFADNSAVEADFRNLDPSNPNAVFQARFDKEDEISANIGTFKLLEQGCLFEYLNVLLTKRNDKDASLASFHQLQGKLDQFLYSSLNVNNPIALLQAQADMLAYEKEVTVLPTAPAAK